MKKQITLIALLFITYIASAQLGGSNPLGSIKEQAGRYFRAGKDLSSSSGNTIYAYFDITGLGTDNLTIARHYYSYNAWADLPTINLKKSSDGYYTNEGIATGDVAYAVMVSEGDKYYFIQSDCKQTNQKYECGFGGLAGLYTLDKGEAKKNATTDYSAQMKPVLSSLNTRLQILFRGNDKGTQVKLTQNIFGIVEPTGASATIKADVLTMLKNHFADKVLPYETIKIFALDADFSVARDADNVLPAFKYITYMGVFKNTSNGKYYAYGFYARYNYQGGGKYSDVLTPFWPSSEKWKVIAKNIKGEREEFEFITDFRIGSDTHELDSDTVNKNK